MAAAYDSDTSRGAPGLRASGLVVGWPGAAAPVLEGIDLTLVPGECVLLSGATGSGKSTLLRALAGLRGVERRAGRLERPRRVSLLLQHVETQLLCTTVDEEVTLGLRSLGLTVAGAEDRVGRALARVGLSGLRRREVDTLSAGQKQRVVLAALLALEPGVLLLDEPGSALDAPSRRALTQVLVEMKAAGSALLVADHAPRELLAAVDRRVELTQGRLSEASPPPCAHDAIADRSAGRGPARACDGLRSLRLGDRVLVTGPNGSGKTTRLRELASTGPTRRDAALVIQEPRRSLFARTVAQEVGFSLERRGIVDAERSARVRALLARFDLLSCADRSPRRLSFGQQHRLAIAAALAARPRLVLLDEPFAGLDPAGRAALLDLLAEEQEESGATLVLASHDRDPLAGWCHRTIELAMEAAGRG